MKHLLVIAALGFLFGCSTQATGRGNYATRPDVREFADELVRTGRYTVDEVLATFEKAVYRQEIIDAVSRPAERTLEWNEYQDIFLTSERVSAGVRFMAENRSALEAARQRYGVPPVIIAAVIGVETMYGRYRGRYRVLDALTTLAFDYAPRAPFFKGELRELFLLAREENQRITDLLGSYAGAMGYGQFIPSSYRRYAVDFDRDGVRDIWNSPADAIGSIANYLAEHGWKAGEDIALQVEPGGTTPGNLFNSDLKPSWTVRELLEHGIQSDVELEPDARVSPLKFEGKNGPEYWLALNNFYVITRYNQSKLYAMAVYQLSERLDRRRLALSANE